jgi:hypothetical protein
MSGTPPPQPSRQDAAGLDESHGFALAADQRRTVDVSNVRFSNLDRDEILGFDLRLPAVGAISETGTMWIDGWIVGGKHCVNAIEATIEGTPFCRFRVAGSTPSLSERYAGVEWAAKAGFRGAIGSVRLPRRFQLHLAIELSDERRLPFAVIEGERAPLPSCDEHHLQPLMMTGLGRSGTTWLMHLLDQHPGIAVFEPFNYEPHIAAYWMEVLAALSEPVSYLQSLSTKPGGRGRWWLGRGVTRFRPPSVAGSKAEEWLAVNTLEALVTTATERIESFYRETARAEHKSARYFSEKFSPGRQAQVLLREIYPGAKEVFLVRDFRDMVASMLAYSAKRDFGLFGRHASASDVDFVLGPMRDAVGILLSDWQRRSRGSILVRYEDLVLNPRGELPKLLDYLGLRTNVSLIEAMLNNATEHRTDKQEEHITSDHVGRSVGRWRRDLPRSVISACDEAFGEALEAFGYAS